MKIKNDEANRLSVTDKVWELSVRQGAYHFRPSFPRWINSVCSVGGMRPEIRMTKYPRVAA